MFNPLGKSLDYSVIQQFIFQKFIPEE